MHNIKTANRHDYHEESVRRDATANVVGKAVSVVGNCDGESPPIIDVVCIPVKCTADVGPDGTPASTLNFRDAARIESRYSIGHDFKKTTGLGRGSDLVCSCIETLKKAGASFKLTDVHTTGEYGPS